MKILLASVAPRAGSGPAQALLEDYVRRTQPFQPTEAAVYRSAEALFAALDRQKGRAAPRVILLDARGELMRSEDLASLVAEHRGAATQLLVFAVGPADGWSEQTRRGHRLLSLGSMTLPHELARVVLAEQVYRACTMLAGHPYHCGHQESVRKEVKAGPSLRSG